MSSAKRIVKLGVVALFILGVLTVAPGPSLAQGLLEAYVYQRGDGNQGIVDQSAAASWAQIYQNGIQRSPIYQAGGSWVCRHKRAVPIKFRHQRQQQHSHRPVGLWERLGAWHGNNNFLLQIRSAATSTTARILGSDNSVIQMQTGLAHQGKHHRNSNSVNHIQFGYSTVLEITTLVTTPESTRRFVLVKLRWEGDQDEKFPVCSFFITTALLLTPPVEHRSGIGTNPGLTDLRLRLSEVLSGVILQQRRNAPPSNSLRRTHRRPGPDGDDNELEICSWVAGSGAGCAKRRRQ